MKNIIRLFLLLNLLSSIGLLGQIHPCEREKYFWKKGWIYQVGSASEKPIKVVAGEADYDISPDFRFLAYTVGYPVGPGDTRYRLKVLSLENKKNLSLDFVPIGNGHVTPRWSPDSRRLCFHYSSEISNKERGDIAIVDIYSSTFCNVTIKLPIGSEASFSGHSWVQPGDSIICHNYNFLYHLDLKGNILQQIRLEAFLKFDHPINQVKFSLSPDNRYLIFDRYLLDSDPIYQKLCLIKLVQHDGPGHSAIFCYDIQKQDLKLLFIEGIDAHEPEWELDGKTIKFIGKDERKSPEASIVYTVTKEGGKPEIICLTKRMYE